MAESVITFFLKWPHLEWWHVIPGMPFDVWDTLRQIAERR